MTISLLYAVADNGVIGRSGTNDLPWHLPADLRRFKKLTLGHAIVMGRRTWESIGRPLPRRRSLVVSRDPAYETGFGPPAVRVVASLDEAFEVAAAGSGADEIFVIGGAQIFELAAPRAQRLYVTRVHGEVEGDVLLPETALPEHARNAWELVACERQEADERHAHILIFEVWERRGSS